MAERNTLYVCMDPVGCICKGRATEACENRRCPHVRRVVVEGDDIKAEDGTELEKSVVKSARRMIK